MATQSPFSWLGTFLQQLPLSQLRPPLWALEEAQRRLLSLVNHILLQEPEALARLARQKGSVIRVQWRSWAVDWVATPAGLFDVAPPAAPADLSLLLTQTQPLALLELLLKGDKPEVRVEGNVQLAAEVNWLVDHVRWDIEEDLARLVGDGPAHALAGGAQTLVQALRQFLLNRVAGPTQQAQP